MAHCRSHQRCISTALKAAESLCEARGARLTASRKEVLERVWHSHVPAKAYDILEQMDPRHHSATPPTVYRALDFLQEQGLVHKINCLNAFVGCSHPARQHGCHFLICQSCHEVTECCEEPIAQVIAEAASRQQFRVAHSHVEVIGLCARCQKH